MNKIVKKILLFYFLMLLFMSPFSVQASLFDSTATSFDTSASGNANPSGITKLFDSFWITDTTDDEVYWYDLSGNYLSFSFDTASAGSDNPVGIAGYNDLLWVLDNTDAEVYQFDGSGTYTTIHFDTAAAGASDPRAIIYGDGFFWITDATDDEVYKFNSDGTYANVSFDTAANGNTSPVGIAVNGGDLWITDGVGGVDQFEEAGTWVATFDISGTVTDPIGIEVDGDYFWVVSTGGAEVYQFDARPPVLIASWADLAAINPAATLDYILTVDLDSTSPGYATYVTEPAQGWVPIGNGGSFSGTSFDGNGHTISDLFINGPSQGGLFDSISNSTITDLSILDVDITTGFWAGGLAYYAGGTTISGVSVTGVLESTSNGMGGLLALADNGTTITNSYTDVVITSTFSTDAGGLVGNMTDGTISNSYALGSILGAPTTAGGLVGIANNTDIIDSYAIVATDGLFDSGGLVGSYSNGSTITNSYAAGAVTTVVTAGGLVSADPSGGLITNSFWDTQTTGQASSQGGGTGKTTLLMKDIDTFTTELGGGTWDFVTDWDINGTDNSGYPFLAWQVFPDATAPTVDTLSPLDNATDVATNTNLVITFSEAVDVETGNITIKKTSDDSTFATIDVTSGLVTGTGTTTITINPATNLSSETEYYVLIDATAFDDPSSNSYAGIASTTAWSFTTADEVSPVISETTPVTASGSDTTPDYTFTSDEAGDITYGGSCTSLTTTASIGANTITFEALALGTYADCTITVTDDALNASNVLAVTSFTITASASGNSYGSRAIKKTVVVPGYPSAPSTTPSDCLPHYVFSPSTGILCLKDIPNRFIFLNNLQSGMIHSDVKELQKYLNTHGYPIALSGAGSLGNETTKFGNLTRDALIKFQQSKGITPAVGFFGPITRGVMNGSI